MFNKKSTTLFQKKAYLCKKQICRIGSLAWQEGLFPAYNGNISVKINEEYILITASGTAKGKLNLADISIMDNAGLLIRGQKLSTESILHLNIYKYTNAHAILHTHPTKLLALDVKNNLNILANLSIYEAQMWSGFMDIVPKFEPGSMELANAVSNGAQTLTSKNKKTLELGALWLSNHGLVAWGEDLTAALNLTEELEHLAEIALLAH